MSSIGSCCVGFKMEEIELRRFERALSGVVMSGGFVSPSEIEKLRFRFVPGPMRFSLGGDWVGDERLGGLLILEICRC